MTRTLQIESLTRRFGSVTAVDAVTLAVDEGEVFGLLGRNGAGKSTLLKILTTLLPPSAGRASVGGFDIVDRSTQVRRLIGYVPQSLSADGELTGYENLLVFARLYDIPRRERADRIREGLEFMGLSDAAHRLVGTYSGGMIRRLEIAQSMLHRPRVLFLDEPTVGLDPVARDVVWSHIGGLRDRYRMTIVLTTHYMEEAERLCTRFGILRRGKLVALGTLDEIRVAAHLGEASLNELFALFTDDDTETVGGYGETAAARQVVQRVG